MPFKVLVRRPKRHGHTAPRYRNMKKKVSKPQKKAITRVIKGVMRSQAEKKSAQYSFTSYPMALQQTGSVINGNYAIMTPSESTYGYNIARGTANNQMVGNKIRITSLIHDFVIYPTPYNVTTNTQSRPSIVRLYYFKSKRYPAQEQNIAQYANSNTTGTADFFDLGSGDYGFVGGLYDLTRKMATDNYTYLTHRTYKIGEATPPITSGSTAYNNLSNNDYKLSVVGKVNLSKYVNANYIQDDESHWTKPWIIMLIQVVAGNGDIYTSSQLPVAVQSNISCHYTDE